MIHVFANQQEGEQCGARKSAKQRGDRSGCHDGRKVAPFLAAELGTDGDEANHPGGDEIKLLADFLTDALKGLGVGGDHVGDHFGGFHRHLIQSLDAGAVAGALFDGPRGFSGVFGLGLRRCVGAGGGPGLSHRFVEKPKQLGGIDLLAFGAVDAPDEFFELLLEQEVALLEVLDFEGLAGADLFERFDKEISAIGVPKDDKSNMNFTYAVSFPLIPWTHGGRA